MAELIVRERLQPSLLDRLADDEVGNPHEPRDRRVLSMRGLRQAVLRDLGWLFNTTRLEGNLQELAAYPLTARSVLNYGLPEWSGTTASGIDLDELEQSLLRAIRNFEPRILSESIEVRAIPKEGGAGAPHQVILEISGVLWGQPLPERLYFKTELDLDLGEIKLFDIGRDAA